MVDKKKKVITLVEGRELNWRTIRDLSAAIEKAGCEVQRTNRVPMYKVAENDMDEFFSNMVIYRDFDGNDWITTERILAWLNKNRKVVINSELVGGRGPSSNKFFQQGIFMMDPVLAPHAIPTYNAVCKQQVKDFLKAKKIAYPFLLKSACGTRGLDITLINDEKDLEAFPDDNFQSMMMEKYIDADFDWRVFVMGGVALGAMRKTGEADNPGNFEAKSGGRNKQKETDPKFVRQLFSLAARIANESGLEYSGIDLIHDKETDEIYILETNCTAGWQNGFTKIVGVDMADETVWWCLARDKALNESDSDIRECVKEYLEHHINSLPDEIRKEVISILSGPDGEFIHDGTHDELVKRLSWAGNYLADENEIMEDQAIESAKFAKGLIK